MELGVVPEKKMGDGFSWRKGGLLALVLAALTFWAFLPVVDNGFVHLDDYGYIIDNAHVTGGLTGRDLAWAFRSTKECNWHPLTWISHQADCQLFGENAREHHLMGLMFHAANAVLLFLVFGRMTGSVWRSFLLAAVFAVHPLRAESVAWAAERKDVLSLFFWLLTLGCYYYYAKTGGVDRPKSRIFYGLALLCFALGLMAKPTVVTLPFVLLLLDAWPLGRISEFVPSFAGATAGEVRSAEWRSCLRLVWEKVPFFLLSAVGSAVTFFAQHHGGAVVPMDHISLGMRWGNTVVSYGRYLAKIFWPVNLASFYPMPEHWGAGMVAGSAILLAVISAAVLIWGGRQRFLVVGWFWFLGTMVPMVGLVQVGAQAMADRYTYIPGIGILIMAVWSIPELRGRGWRLGVAGLAAMGIMALCLATRQQTRYWKDTETLFRRECAVNADKYDPLIRLGAFYLEDGRVDEAMGRFQEAIALHPGLPRAHVRLAAALHAKRRLDAAMAAANEALRLDPGSAMAHGEKGSILMDEGRPDLAVKDYEESAKLNPNDAPGYFNWGLALCFLGRYGDAVGPLAKAAELEPEHARNRYNLGIALLHTGRLEEAIGELRAAEELEPKVLKTHYRLGMALEQAGRKEEAAGEFREALRLEPGYAEAGKELEKLGVTLK